MPDPAAPIHILSDVQHEALVGLFFVGEMYRCSGRYVAEGLPDLHGTTVAVLHRQSLVKLIVTKHPQAGQRKAPLYRHSIALTERGLWFARTIIRKREADAEAVFRTLNQTFSPCAIDDLKEFYAEAAE